MYRDGHHLLLQTSTEGLGVCPLQLNDYMETSNLAHFLKQDTDFFLCLVYLRCNEIGLYNLHNLQGC